MKYTHLKSRNTGSVQKTTGSLNEYVIDQEQVKEGEIVIVEERGHYEPFDDGNLYEITEEEYTTYVVNLPEPAPTPKSKIQKLIEWAELEGHI